MCLFDNSGFILQAICIGYITRGRSLRDLHTRGPQARGNVNHRREEQRLAQANG